MANIRATAADVILPLREENANLRRVLANVLNDLQELRKLTKTGTDLSNVLDRRIQEIKAALDGSPAPSDGFWDCANCAGKNAESETKCRSCGQS
jgi:hypothetical protein